MSRIDKSNYIHTLQETLYALGAVSKVLMADRVANRAELSNIAAAMKNITMALATHNRNKQRTRREEQRERLEEERQRKQRLQQS